MDKKTSKIVISLLLISVFFFALCTENKGTAGNGITASTVSGTAAVATTSSSTTTTPGTVPLSDLQKSACNSADAGHTCQTKLADLGIVSPDDCCKYLDKCCPVN